ncbi:DUF6046 domain-containing protein [Riemerella columbipharyngis]|uniref:DUF6046 domain-containing protein n=1 Tax=Riemerella columbipharyngis TaxID=1071918 RepID=A0A1G7FMK0_9FLAO|nr:DUF6046 domain-containing protein [Riemerella columbipharyngis]SDE77074.1 hypothetical protein SAMN05421544_12421 [Riemerella columbipharyngis]
MEIDIKELTAKAFFSYVGPAFPLWWERNKTKFVLPSLNRIGAALLNGQPYFQMLKVQDLKSGEIFDFPNEPLITLSLTKTIVETATVGKERRGTVKEYICTEDYQLTIKGLCMNEDPERREEYPTKQVQTLQRLFEINNRLEVLSNPFLALFGIKSIVLKDIQWEEMAGEQGLQKYSITAVSDNDFYADQNEKKRVLS